MIDAITSGLCGTVSDFILVLDFGGQYGHLIARRFRERGFFSMHVPVNAFDVSEITGLASSASAIVLSGGPLSVWEKKHDEIAKVAINSGKPLLGICYGHQLLARVLGARVDKAPRPEYGPSQVLLIDREDPLLAGLPQIFTVWFSHNDAVLSPSRNMRTLAVSLGSPVAAFHARIGDVGVYGVQWHPEVSHTEFGADLLERWAALAGLFKNWSPEVMLECVLSYARKLISEKAPEGPIVAAVSGGVDSTVATVIAYRVAGKRVLPVIIDHGFHPLGEVERAVRILRSIGLEPVVLDESERFLRALEGISDPEEKRRTISKLYFEILLEVVRDTGAKGLIQGTIYPDIVESGAIPGADRIKSHHNVAMAHKLPRDTALIEPLAWLYKDEVRRIGLLLGLSEDIVFKQPVPGPGLAVRIEGEVTRDKLELIRKADKIVRDIVESRGIHRGLWQYFAVLTASKATGVKGDKRVYGHVVAVRIVESSDAMTASPARVKWEVLEEIASRITSLQGVSRVVYDITSKPPATIEWE